MALCSQIITRKLYSALDPAVVLRSRASFLPITRKYATQSSLGGASGPSRKQITVTTDDGRVRWGDLSAREKAARTTQQSINFVVVITGVIMTVRDYSPNFHTPLTIGFRVEWSTSSGLKSSLQTARLGISTRPSIESRMIPGVRICLEAVRRSKHLESQLGINGQELGRLRKSYRRAFWHGADNWD
jgi:hypothetical protein